MIVLPPLFSLIFLLLLLSGLLVLTNGYIGKDLLTKSPLAQLHQSRKTLTAVAVDDVITTGNNNDKNAVEMTASTTDDDSEEIDFPPPLSLFQRAQRSIEFYKRTLPVLAAYKAKELELEFRRTVVGDVIDNDEEDLIWKELDEWGSHRIANTIQEMKGFYVKTGQVISTRVDLFPEAYTSKLQELQDGIEPMPFELVEKVVRQELLDGAELSELFETFEKEPLGAASIAQVHKATLLDGRVVAVKLQRPNVEPKLLGDIANLKRISKALAEQLPVDYYTVFCELEHALKNELDFLAEAQAMRKIDLAISHDTDGTATNDRPVTIPLPVGELVSKRVLVMDFCDGIPLNKLEGELKARGIEPGSPEAKLAGRRILDALALAFGRMIFGAGFVHGDPHPGNIFIGKGGKVSLIDCGQFKALSRLQRVKLAELVLAVGDYQKAEGTPVLPDAKTKLAELVRGFGVTLTEGKENDNDLACAVALLLFGDSDQVLPGGYSTNELSEDSPIKQVTSFPQELVLLGRATVLLKGIAKRLGVKFSLAERLSSECYLTMDAASKPVLPLWGKDVVGSSAVSSMDTTAGGGGGDTGSVAHGNNKIRFRQVTNLLRQWGKGKMDRFSGRAMTKLPPSMKTKILQAVLDLQEWKEAREKSTR